MTEHSTVEVRGVAVQPEFSARPDDEARRDLRKHLEALARWEGEGGAVPAVELLRESSSSATR